MKLFGILERLTQLILKNGAETTTIDPASGASPTLTAPSETSTLVGDTATQTLTNKTIDGDDNTVQDLPDTAIKTEAGQADNFFTRDGSGIPESSTKSVPAGDVVGTTDSQTLTNKTLTSPSITTPTGIVKGDVGLGNVDNTSDATKDAATATLTNKTLTSPVIDTGVSGTAILDEDNMASDSATQLATQQSIKAYADTKMVDVVDDTTPQLGGDLDVNGNAITSTTGNDVVITTASGSDDIDLKGIARITNNGLYVGGATDNSAGILLNSTESGIGLSQVTEAQRDAISSPRTGLVVFNTTDSEMNVYNGTEWVTAGGGGLTPEFEAVNFTAAEGTNHILTANMTAITFPAGEDGDTIRISRDRAGGVSWETSNITITPDGSETMDGDATFVLDTDVTDYIDFIYQASGTNWISVSPITIGGGGGGGLVPTNVAVGDSPLTAETGKFYLVNTSGGEVVINMPKIATQKEQIGIQLVDATNACTINSDAADFLAPSIKEATIVVANDWRIYNAYQTNRWQSYSNPAVGAIITDWEAFTPSSTYDGTGTEVGSYSRVGSHMYIQYNINKAGAADGSGNINLTLPDSLNVDTTSLFTNSERSVIGYGKTNNGSGTHKAVSIIIGPTTDILRFRETNADSDLNSNEAAILGVTIGPIPISEWAGTGTTQYMNDNVINANARAHYTGANQTITGLTQIDFNTEVYLEGGVTESAGVFTVPSDGKYFIEASVQLTTDQPSQYLGIYIGGVLHTQGQFTPTGSGASTRNAKVSRTLELSQGDTVGAAFTASGTASSGANENYLSITRIADYSAGQPVGFGLVSSSGAGLQPAISDGTFVAAAGEIGEVLSDASTGGSISAPTNKASIVLTPGTWDVSGAATMSDTSTVAGEVSIGPNSATMDGTVGLSLMKLNSGVAVSGTATASASIPPFTVTVTSNTTYYLNVNNFNSAITYDGGSIRAIRVR